MSDLEAASDNLLWRRKVVRWSQERTLASGRSQGSQIPRPSGRDHDPARRGPRPRRC